MLRIAVVPRAQTSRDQGLVDAGRSSPVPSWSPAPSAPASWKCQVKTRPRSIPTSTRKISAFTVPGGFESDYAGLTAYFASIRAAFDDRKITRGIIVAEGSTVACQTWIEGTFVREFTQSPAGPLPRPAQRSSWT